MSQKNGNICFADKKNANTFKYFTFAFFFNLASDLATKLPFPSKRFRLDTVRNYYQDILGLLPSKFKFDRRPCTTVTKGYEYR